MSIKGRFVGVNNNWYFLYSDFHVGVKMLFFCFAGSLATGVKPYTSWADIESLI